jgi:hypothetical protein
MRRFCFAVLMAAAISLIAAAAEARGGGGSHSGGGARAGSAMGSGAMSLTIPSARAPQSGALGAAASGPPSSSSSGDTLSVSPPQPPPSAAASPSPPSQIGQPAPQAAAIAPLSPQLQTQFATGGTTNSNLALSPGSPSESAPSTPGGGGKTLQACMNFWEPATHMSKTEWRDACKRTMEEYPNVR